MDSYPLLKGHGRVSDPPLQSVFRDFPPSLRAVTIFGRQRRQARPIRRPSLNIAPFRFVVGDAFRLNTHPLRAVTIFAVASHAKIPSTPHNHPRASASPAPNKKGEYEIRPYEIANCILQ